jgi:hypothetical protein
LGRRPLAESITPQAPSRPVGRLCATDAQSLVPVPVMHVLPVGMLMLHPLVSMSMAV